MNQGLADLFTLLESARPSNPARLKKLAPLKEWLAKSGFQEKCENSFCGKSTAENISEKTGVVSPVGSEMKVHNYATGDPYGKIKDKDFSSDKTWSRDRRGSPRDRW